MLRNAQKRDKKIQAKQPRERRKKGGGKKATFFVISPDDFLFAFAFFYPPCYETLKNAIKE
jgi:hypothetical protein